jgi:hypothetical protein
MLACSLRGPWLPLRGTNAAPFCVRPTPVVAAVYFLEKLYARDEMCYLGHDAPALACVMQPMVG